jgi:hypothetical protein
VSIAHLADSGLPFNRKERFFTGTVLPMLVCTDGFAHFGRLTELVGLGRIDVDPHPDSTNVQFFTEYSFVESVIGDARTSSGYCALLWRGTRSSCRRLRSRAPTRR